MIYWYDYWSKKKSNKWLWKKNLKFINDAVFVETMENVRKNRDIKPVTTDRRRNYWVLESNYQTRKLFTENLLAIEMKKSRDTYE